MFDTSLSALTAAGGNSRAARSMRARLQWRDRFGRWIEMGRGVKFKVRGADGATRSVIGSFVGAKSNTIGQVYVQKDPNGLPDGFYDVDSANAQEFIANLDESQLAARGIEVGKDANGKAVGERASEAVPNINQMKAAPAPEGWEAIPGTFGGKKVIQTDDGDFRVHFGGKDETVLLEDHRAAPGQAEPQRSVGEAFKRVGDVDVQREESGDAAYTGLAEGNDEKLASIDRDTKVEQIKFNERTINNEKAGLTARQQATTNNETLKKELADAGQPYDPEGDDSDEALAARKAAPESTPEAADPATPEAGGAPIASTGEVDLSTFDVSPEGFLIPTGKSTNDISRDGLASFMTAEKESLSSGGSRLVVDTDAKTAEIYNSADTLDDAKAQAGGLGQDTVLDLSTGQPVQVSEGAVDPNSADVNPNLEGKTTDAPTGGAPDAQDRDPNAVESQPANPGADAPASGEPDAEARDGADPAARAADPSSDEPGREGAGPAASDPAAGTGDDTDTRTSSDRPSADPGSAEELKQRRAQAQSALDNAGDPKDIIALNEQIDALDNRIAAKDVEPETPERPSAADIDSRMSENEASREEILRLANEANGNADTLRGADLEALEARANQAEIKADDLNRTLQRLQNREIPKLEKEYADLRRQLDEANGVQELDFDADRSTPDAPEADVEPEAPERLPLDVESRQKLVGDLTDEELIAEINRMDQAGDIAEENGSSTDQIDAHLENLRTELDRRASELDNPENWTAPEELDDTSLDSELKARSDMEWGSGARPTQDEERIRELASEQARRAFPEGAQRLRESQMAEEMELPEGPIEDVPESELYNILETNEKVSFRQLQKTDWATVSRIKARAEVIRSELSRRDVEAGNDPRFPFGKTDDNGVDQQGFQWGAEIRVSGTDMRNNALDTRELIGRPAATEPEEQDTSIADPRAAAEARLAQAEQDYDDVLMDPDYTEEQYEAAEQARADAQSALDALDAPEAAPEPVDAPDPRVAELEAERDRLQQVIERNEQETPRAEVPDEGAASTRDKLRAINDEIAARENNESQLDPDETPSGLYEPGDDPYNVESGNDNKVAAIKAKMQGKDLSEEERAELEQALGSGLLSDNQVARISEVVDSAPNAANTGSKPRPDTDQPNYLSRADQDIIQSERDDPNYVFDEDLTWRTVQEENPDAVRLDNGDLIVETTNNKGKKYDAIVRRTQQNRFMVYIMETDSKGVRRAKRLSNSEFHSYEALENRIQVARQIINADSPAGSITRRRDYPTELLGTQSFPADDFIGDIGNPDAPIPATGDAKFDQLLEAAALHIRAGDLDIDGIEDVLREIDPKAKAVSTVMNAIIGRAQDNYRPSGINPWQTYDGETAEIGAEYDWTDWHQEKDWWLPNGKRNPNRKPNRNYGQVKRVRVMGYVKENKDGKGHTYGDHVWVSVQNDDGSWGNWSARSAQTLRRAEPGSAPGLPFFSKREEWRSDPEKLARRFRVPNAAPDDDNVKTKPRPKGDLPQSRRLRFTNGGNLAGYGNVPVPNSPAEIAGMITSEEITPNIAPAHTARPGMLIARRDDNGNQFVDSIIRVDNLGDGSYRIHAARPDGTGSADVDTFVVPGDADIAIWSAPELRAPAKPEPDNSRQGEVVSIGESGTPGVILHDDGEGSLIVSTPEGTVDVPAAEVKAPEAGEYPTVEFLQSEIDRLEEDRIRMGNGSDSALSQQVNTQRINTLRGMIELAEQDWKTDVQVLVFDGKVASGEPRKGQYGLYYVLSDEAAAAYGKRFFNPSNARNARERDAAKGFTYQDVKVPVTPTENGTNFTINTRGLVGQDISVLRDTEVQSNAVDSQARSDLLSVTDEMNIPPALRDLLRRWAMDPRVSDAELDGIMSLMRNFNTMSPIERLIDQILSRLGVSSQVRSSILNNN
ncbi:hypothetical protein SEA_PAULODIABOLI_85 [Microbacterium phage PauloDiaboli]|nr:hypothetical protein SEA_PAULODIABOLI_85 [Microbacterium phage PauloDiaboli]